MVTRRELFQRLAGFAAALAGARHVSGVEIDVVRFDAQMARWHRFTIISTPYGPTAFGQAWINAPYGDSTIYGPPVRVSMRVDNPRRLGVITGISDGET